MIDVRPRALELGHQRRQIGRARRIGFLQHDLADVLFVGKALVGLLHAGAVGAVLVDQRDLQVRGLGAELRLAVFAEQRDRRLAIGVRLRRRAKDIAQMPVLQHRGGDRAVDPQDLFGLVDFGGERHRLRARIDAEDDVDLFLGDQPLGLVDRDIDLALRVGADRLDLVFAENAALAVDMVDRELRADRQRHRAGAGKGPGKIVQQPDADRFSWAKHPGQRQRAARQPRRSTDEQAPPSHPSPLLK